ncbi:ammonium transporter [Amphritea sp. 2_MG-2023]|uniref:ammonium transporter n=1 Tax=Amphritea TaxID=515417 RepID=UPI001C0767CD|nr:MULTISPECIES: ammonium transporter [Amphritea]MBU2966036.1 ammonium transporter [Amphritea atlantica]MDO6418126.1 ammonium transporter [Amphritea sp. 2_MG-2023]
MDLLWILFGAMLVFMMQAGFLCLESGLVRSKNSINVAAKNITDFIISSTLFWAFGFAFMFGDSYSDLIGTSGFFFGENASPRDLSIFLFQMMFCGTAATLVSGAVAERMSYLGYIITSIIISLLIYPIVGHWAWGGVVSGTTSGWLALAGFVDFAGSTMVHSVGGWVALAAIIVIGPRIGRFNDDKRHIPGSNIPIAMLGALLLWFGWFGFNGGSTLAWTDAVPGILLNTCLAAFWGGIAAIVIKYLTDGYIDISQIINGVLGGLVAITANCHAVSVTEAAFIAGIAGFIVVYSSNLLLYLKLDDAIGVIPVHLFAGIWGTIAVALFGEPAILGTGLSRPDQLASQFMGIATVGLYSFSVAYIMLSLINKMYPLRVSSDAELNGLNVSEHRVTTEVFDLLSAMNQQQIRSDYSSPVPVEPFTEVGQIAQEYNRVIDKVQQEIQERDRAFNAFKESEYRNGAILEAAMDCIITINEQAQVVTFNPAAEQCFGITASIVLGEDFFQLFMEAESRKLAAKSLAKGFTTGEGLVLKRQNISNLTRYDKETFPAEIVVTQTTDLNAFKKQYTLHIRDITKQVKLQNRLKLLAYNDPLTGLYNRTYLMRTLERLIVKYTESPGTVVLMFLDLDQFKRINDTLGHNAGDILLREVAKRLKTVIRDSDLVARWGGDEFVIVLSGQLDESLATKKANEILTVMRDSITLLNNELTVLTSIGIAMSVNGQTNAERLLQHADLAMYQAKNNGRNTYSLFLPQMEKEAQLHSWIENELPSAMQNHQLYLQYQPKVNCVSNTIVGFEALLRWQHPEHGFVSPAEFIPVIENTNLIITVGEWVLSEVTQQLANWREEGVPLLPIAVNISGYHLHSPTLIPYIDQCLRQRNLNPELIEIEITEGALTGNSDESIDAMRALKAIHIKLAIDDFGTGYSSLSYLKKFPVDILKIDRAFVRECYSNKEDAAICKAIISLAKSLELEIVAEGVENQAQLAFLGFQGCDIYQGFYFSKAVSADKVTALLMEPLPDITLNN